MNKRIFQRCADVTEPKMRANMSRSADNSKSGRTGYRPTGHAADNIPVKVSKSKAEVGWNLKGDAENFFYMKFVEWGTTKQPAQDFIYNTLDAVSDEISSIAEQECQTMLNQKLGG
jgi:HK97 gp10 family phage protein